MSYPNQPQGYPPQQPAYPPQQPAYPPQQPAYQPPPQPAYPPQQQGYYPPPGPFTAPEMRHPQPPRGTIDSFYDQPANSGKSISSWFQTPGQSLTGIVARELTDADTSLQTDMQTKQPLPPRADGSYRWTMTVPLLVTPSSDFPEGRAAWIVSSTDRGDLDAAMHAAGCPPKTVPEAGAIITITFTGYRQIPGFGVPKKVKQITYQRPASGNGNGQAPAPPVQQAPPEQPPWDPQTRVIPPGTFQQPPVPMQPPPQQDPYQTATGYPTVAAPPQYQQQPPPGYGMPPTQTAPQQYQQAPPNPTTQTPYATAPAPSAAPATSAPPATAPNAPPPNGQQYAVPADLTPEQAQRLRELTGQ